MSMLFSPVVIAAADERLFRHDSRQAALEEAKRLAQQNPGKRFAVYVPVSAVSIPETPVRVETISGDSEADIPF